MKEADLIKGNSYYIIERSRSDGLPNMSFSGTGIFTGKKHDIHGMEFTVTSAEDRCHHMYCNRERIYIDINRVFMDKHETSKTEVVKSHEPVAIVPIFESDPIAQLEL